MKIIGQVVAQASASGLSFQDCNVSSVPVAMSMWCPLWPQDGCWLGLQRCQPTSLAVAIPAICGMVFLRVGASAVVIFVETGASSHPTECFFELLPVLSAVLMATVLSTFYIMSPTATKANVIHLGFALLIGFSLTLSFMEPLGNGATVKVVTRRLGSVSICAVLQLILFKTVSAPLMLFHLLGIAIYLARVCMASAAESGTAYRNEYFLVFQTFYGGLAILITLVVPNIKARVESHSAQVLPTTHQGTSPAPPTTQQGTMLYRLAPRSNAPVRAVPQPPLMHSVASTSCGATDPQVSLAQGSGPAGSGVGDDVQVVDYEEAAPSQGDSASSSNETPPRITTPTRMMDEDHLSHDSTGSPHVITPELVPRVCIRRLSGQLVLDEPLPEITDPRRRLGAVWRLKQIIANRVNVRPEKQDLFVRDRPLTDNDLVPFGPVAPLDVMLIESFDDDSTELARRTEPSTPSDLAFDDDISA